MYKVLLFKSRRHLCKGSIDILVEYFVHVFSDIANDKCCYFFFLASERAGILNQSNLIA